MRLEPGRGEGVVTEVSGVNDVAQDGMTVFSGENWVRKGKRSEKCFAPVAF